MASPSSSPSEGEIVESDSEKATTAPTSKIGTSVDRPFRTYASVSRSPSPIRSPRRHKSRSESRSPYREPRGVKRSPDDDHYDRCRNDPRRFKVRYEDYPANDRSRPHDSYNEPGQTDRSSAHDYRDTNGRRGEVRPRTRSRSPTHLRTQRWDHDRHSGKNRASRAHKDHWREQSGRGYNESRRKLSKEQSVSDRGHSSVAAAQIKHDAESRNTQAQHSTDSIQRLIPSTAKYVHLRL